MVEEQSVLVEQALKNLQQVNII